jgi:hypothetical protein
VFDQKAIELSVVPTCGEAQEIQETAHHCIVECIAGIGLQVR